MSESTLRPLSVGEILDGAFALFRRNLVVLVVTTLIAMTPSIATQFLIRMHWAFAFLNLGVILVVYPFIAVALTWQISELVLGRKAAVESGLACGFRRLFAAVLANFVRTMAIVFGMFLVLIPGFYVALRTFATIPIVTLEPGASWWSRSGTLFEGQWKKVLAVSLVSWFIVLMPGLALGVATGSFSLDRETREAAQSSVLQIVLGWLLQSVTLPFSTAVTVLLYYDLRVRKEGLDVKLAGEAIGGEAAGATA